MKHTELDLKKSDLNEEGCIFVLILWAMIQYKDVIWISAYQYRNPIVEIRQL